VDFVYVPVFVVAGLAIDWAFFWNTDNVIRQFWDIRDGYGYRDLLFPRSIVTVISSAIFGIGAMQAPPSTPLLVAGGALFLAANFYADYLILRFGRRK
jgi:hypothetical protein